MSTAVCNGAKTPYLDKLIHIVNQMKRLLVQATERDLFNIQMNMIFQVIHLNDIGSGKHSSKIGLNKQENTKISTANSTTSYFNTTQQQQQFNKRSNESSLRLHRDSPRQSFPPFSIRLQNASRYPTTELNLIKEINKHCKVNLTYGRYTKTSDNQMCFLLYASITAQFEYLMSETNWLTMINNTEFILDLPNKIPPSYSIVIQNVHSQWNTQAFENELKQHYPSIVRVVRLFVNRGRPLSKVRMDFSSYKEFSNILKAKRI
jgi:hypothetical protein